MKQLTSFPQWKGFENSPDGCLLEQVIDLSPKMGFAYERSCQFYKDFHTHDRLMLVCPRGASAMEVRTVGLKETFKVDSESILIVPKGVAHDDEGVSCIYDTMALYPKDELIFETALKLGLKKNQLKFETCIKLYRSRKLDQLIQEYFFERVIAKTAGNENTLEYLASKILCEVLGLLFPGSANSKPFKQITHNENSVAQRALCYIESNLFASMDLKNIAKYSGASIATLLRKFKIEINQTPFTYIRSRRLEEALYLLKAGSHSVGEVALLVGYENFGAFTDAFKGKYGVPPSHHLLK